MLIKLKYINVFVIFISFENDSNFILIYDSVKRDFLFLNLTVVVRNNNYYYSSIWVSCFTNIRDLHKILIFIHFNMISFHHKISLELLL